MQRFDLNQSKLTPNFIGSWIIEPSSLCDDLITYFEVHQKKQKRGVTGSGFNPENKNSTDIAISPKEINLPGNEVLKEYFSSLFCCHKDYLMQWPFLEKIGKNESINGFGKLFLK